MAATSIEVARSFGWPLCAILNERMLEGRQGAITISVRKSGRQRQRAREAEREREREGGARWGLSSLFLSSSMQACKKRLSVTWSVARKRRATVQRNQ